MARTLWEVLGSIADRRGRKGRQFPLQAILAIAAGNSIKSLGQGIAIERLENIVISGMAGARSIDGRIR